MEPILDVKQLCMDFGGLRALNEVDFKIFEGEITALIGPNGAGKTTFFNCISGIYKPTAGQVTIRKPDSLSKVTVNGFRPNKVASLGMTRTFQNIRLFQNMTVLENVMIGRHPRTVSGIFVSLFRTPKMINEEKSIVEDSYKLLEKMELADLANEFAKNLSYGAQRRLEIARAMAGDPFLILLDEPAAGMNPQETLELDGLIRKIRDVDKIGILLIEHDMKLVMNISDRIYVLDYGSIIAAGSPDQIKTNKAVVKAYLGEEENAQA